MMIRSGLSSPEARYIFLAVSVSVHISVIITAAITMPITIPITITITVTVIGTAFAGLHQVNQVNQVNQVKATPHVLSAVLYTTEFGATPWVRVRLRVGDVAGEVAGVGAGVGTAPRCLKPPLASSSQLASQTLSP